ncbi:MAG: PilW family protein [Rubrivivax sp.]|jgi:type IV pilus assembly protein PilW|nr:PilW family protein [Rubrivivax sp.]
MSGPDRLFPPRRPRRAAPRRQRGLSIVELMVGIVIALLVGLAATIGAVSFTASQRQGVGAGGASAGAGAALAAIKNDAASAGLGFFGDGRYLCNRLNLSQGAAVVVDGALFSPVRVTAEAAGDRIDIVYATQVAGGTNVLLDATSDASGAQLQSLLPAAVGEAVLLAPDLPGAACTVRTVTTNAAATFTTPQTLTFAAQPGAVHNQAAFTNAVTYPENGRVTLLGALRWNRYRLDGTDLLVEQPLAGTSTVLARNVVALRAQYGVADAAPGSTTLETWESAEGADFGALTAAALPRVRALRIGVVTRSVQREKADGGGSCTASTDKPQLFGEEVEPDVSDWQCFRYRTAVAVVPLRNLVMGFTP